LFHLPFLLVLLYCLLVLPCWLLLAHSRRQFESRLLHLQLLQGLLLANAASCVAAQLLLLLLLLCQPSEQSACACLTCPACSATGHQAVLCLVLLLLLLPALA
jgi:hypothetical protein